MHALARQRPPFGTRLLMSTCLSWVAAVSAAVLRVSVAEAQDAVAAPPDATLVPDWSSQARIPAEGRANPYGFSQEAWAERVRGGRLHALRYPVEITGELLPYEPMSRFFADTRDTNPLRALLRIPFGFLTRIRTLEDVETRLGLHPFPVPDATGVYAAPYPTAGGGRPHFRMGTSFIQTSRGLGLTFSCATCHAGNLFGRSVLGMTNRFPRANEFFIFGKDAVQRVDPHLFQVATGATQGERAMFTALRDHARAIGAVKPQVLGLDTSLAHTALSLSRRAPDAHATRDASFERQPRPNVLERQVADSKPAVWWTLKYKTRWLLDGSVVSGNPIFTNLIWNEIGRGTDLTILKDWLERNAETVTDLTAAVFAAEAPRYTDFFPAASIDEASAMRGQALFRMHCGRCHGTYDKGWDASDAAYRTPEERLRTVRVSYHERTPVIDVGTDPQRASGMAGLEEGLNRLALSQANGVVVQVQRGYVPPPLVGIWARWPYFHNNSTPSLCAVLTKASERPKAWHAGEPVDARRDFDAVCNGYPLGAKTPAAWRRNEAAFMDTRRPGLGNAGHDEGIFLDKGRELMTPSDKKDLISFLKTL